MLSWVKNFLGSLDYGDDYIALWVTSTMFFLAVALGPAIAYLLFYAEIDKSVKTAMRANTARDRETEESSPTTTKRSGSARRRSKKKRWFSRRLILVHAPALSALLALGTLVAYGLTRLLSST